MVYLVVEYVRDVLAHHTLLKSIHGTLKAAVKAKRLGDVVLKCKLGTEEKDWEEVE